VTVVSRDRIVLGEYVFLRVGRNVECYSRRRNHDSATEGTAIMRLEGADLVEFGLWLIGANAKGQKQRSPVTRKKP
jgi:hypothetical protein